MSIIDNLRYYIRKKDITEPELSRKSGIPQPTIWRILHQNKTDPSPQNVIKLALGLGITEAELRFGNPHIDGEISNAEDALPMGNFKRVPVVGTAQLGDNGNWTELEYPVGHGDGYISYPTRDPNAYALRCRGDSMRPRIKEGEFVIVEPGTEPMPGDEVLVKSKNGRVMVKTLLYQREGKVHLMSVNEAHQPQSFNLEEIELIHSVVAIVKRALWVKE